MKSVKVCSACEQIEKHWNNLFDEVCDKCENMYNELEKVQLQLSIEKAKQMKYEKKSQPSTRSLRTKAQYKMNTTSQAGMGTQTLAVKQPTNEKNVQTDHTNAEVSTQTFAVKQPTNEKSVQTDHTNADVTTQTFPVKPPNIGEDMQTDDTYVDETFETPPATPNEPLLQNDDVHVMVHNDHPYADPQQKPFSCRYCVFKSARKYNRDKHEEICPVRSEIEIETEFESENMLYECRVCKKLCSYEQLRKHYLQFITSKKQKKSRNGHNDVSKETHEFYLAELKANKQ